MVRDHADLWVGRQFAVKVLGVQRLALTCESKNAEPHVVVSSLVTLRLK
ncbi:MAG: hypothetical protein ACRDLL_03580 [Solirubrobacterales bacterium]